MFPPKAGSVWQLVAQAGVCAASHVQQLGCGSPGCLASWLPCCDANIVTPDGTPAGQSASTSRSQPAHTAGGAAASMCDEFVRGYLPGGGAGKCRGLVGVLCQRRQPQCVAVADLIGSWLFSQECAGYPETPSVRMPSTLCPVQPVGRSVSVKHRCVSALEYRRQCHWLGGRALN